MQKLLDKYDGHGIIKRTAGGKWSNKEKIIFDKPIGFVKNKDGLWVETNKGMIHYSKTGTHIVPTLEEDKNDRK